ncbi:MAG: glycosyltransferase family 4 protein [Eubacteriales bacterium]|nr:glycosyltransferase family 4 protein [Eubacteriales bacterium]
MKILHALAQLPTRTGSGVYFRNLLREFSKQAGSRQIALFAEPLAQPVDFLDTKDLYPIVFETEELPFPMPGMSDEMPYKSSVYGELSKAEWTKLKNAYREQLLLIKKEHDPDIIICHHLWLLARTCLEVFPDRPVYGICHGTDIRQARQHPDLAREWVGELSNLRLVFALSEEQIAAIEELYKLDSQQIIVTGGAYDQEVFYPLPEAQLRALKRDNLTISDDFSKEAEISPFSFCYAGKLVRSKGVFELLAATKKLRAEGYNIELKLIGQSNPELTEYIEVLGLDNSVVKVYDVKSQSDLAAELRVTDCFVFASYYEGLGLIALEALASGMRLVVNQLPALCEQLNVELKEQDFISWVKLPRIVNVDEAVDEDIPAYVERLAAAMIEQYKRSVGEDLATRVALLDKLLSTYRWSSLSARIFNLLD